MLLYVWTITSSFSASHYSCPLWTSDLTWMFPLPLLFITASVPVIPHLSANQTVPLLLIFSFFSSKPDTLAHLWPSTTSSGEYSHNAEEYWYPFSQIISILKKISWRELTSYLLSRALVGKLNSFLTQNNSALKHHGSSHPSHQSREASENQQPP